MEYVKESVSERENPRSENIQLLRKTWQPNQLIIILWVSKKKEEESFRAVVVVVVAIDGVFLFVFVFAVVIATYQYFTPKLGIIDENLKSFSTCYIRFDFCNGSLLSRIFLDSLRKWIDFINVLTYLGHKVKDIL